MPLKAIMLLLRGLARGQIFDRQGRLIATTQQEGLIRYTPEKGGEK